MRTWNLTTPNMHRFDRKTSNSIWKTRLKERETVSIGRRPGFDFFFSKSVVRSNKTLEGWLSAPRPADFVNHFLCVFSLKLPHSTAWEILNFFFRFIYDVIKHLTSPRSSGFVRLPTWNMRRRAFFYLCIFVTCVLGLPWQIASG